MTVARSCKLKPNLLFFTHRLSHYINLKTITLLVTLARSCKLKANMLEAWNHYIIWHKTGCAGQSCPWLAWCNIWWKWFHDTTQQCAWWSLSIAWFSLQNWWKPMVLKVAWKCSCLFQRPPAHLWPICPVCLWWQPCEADARLEIEFLNPRCQGCFPNSVLGPWQP